MSSESKNVIKIAAQPPGMKCQLFKHQLANIFQMQVVENTKRIRLGYNLEAVTSIAVLGDPPGTGKTKTIFGVILHDKMPWECGTREISTQACSNVNGSIRIISKNEVTQINTNLIVSPPSIVNQWEAEAKDSGLTFKVVRRVTDIVSLEEYDIVICTSTMYNTIALQYSRYRFKRFIYDEMDSCYIANMEAISAGFTWFISATFDRVFEEIVRSRRKHYLKRIFMNIVGESFDQERLLNALTIKSTPELRALQNFTVDMKDIYYNEIRSAPVVQELGRYMPEDIIQMVNSGNIREAIEKLGGTTQDVDLSEVIHRKISDEVDEAEEKVSMYSADPKQKASLKFWKERLEIAQANLADIKKRLEKIRDTSDCPICYTGMDHPVLYSCCQNIFCAACTAHLIGKPCPMCRETERKLVYFKGKEIVNGEVKEEKKLPPPVTKFDFLERIIFAGKKILIFSTFDGAFDDIQSFLISKGISCSLLKGTSKQRSDIVNAYVDGKTKVLILNSRQNGSGLNLQPTTDIIFWHKQSKNIMPQLVGRVIRTGLNHPVLIHHFYREEPEDEESPSCSSK